MALHWILHLFAVKHMKEIGLLAVFLLKLHKLNDHLVDDLILTLFLQNCCITHYCSENAKQKTLY